jgi:hypothetical protein
MCNNFILIRPRRPIQTGCVSCIGELALLAKCGLKTLKKESFCGLRHMYVEDNIKIDRREMGCGDIWIKLAQDGSSIKNL